MEGTGEGCGFFCSLQLPYLSTISKILFHRLKPLYSRPLPSGGGRLYTGQTRSPSNLMGSRPNLTANGYCVQTSSLTNVEVRETNFTIIYQQASYLSCAKKFSLWNIILTLFNSTIKGECCWVM